jgi:hypothetical protein
MRTFSLFAILLLSLPAVAEPATPGNRLAHLDELDPYYPHAKFPKFITPQWIGEPGVDAVIVLAIDDMRDPKKYETFLRPILNRLKKIDGRAPVSIMTCDVDPHHEQLQAWLKEGLSFEVHTITHPCPYFKPGFDKAKESYDRCVDLLHAIPGNKPVAFRMPCCDSLNTPSPRHWAEIFGKKTAMGRRLSLDSSVFMVYTSADPELPKDLVLEEGKERFEKYLPADRDFVNWIENYPYPYLVGRNCWQFPCMTPSDWQANHLHKPNNPLTVRDWKAALDCTVIKKGVFNLVFHPHGWIKPEQVIDFIDHAVGKHGKKVKFLTFKEAHDRLQKSLFPGRDWPAAARDIHLLDVNNDGFIDVVDLGRDRMTSRIWQPAEGSWKTAGLPRVGIRGIGGGNSHFAILQKNGCASVVSRLAGPPMGIDRMYQSVCHFDGEKWLNDDKVPSVYLQQGRYVPLFHRLIDIDGDGICEMIDRNGLVFAYRPGNDWQALSFTLPTKNLIGLRFLDLNGDGKLDLAFSNEKEYGIYLFSGMIAGWKKVRGGKTGDENAFPMITRNGTNNGCWAHSRQLWWANEDTVLLKNSVDRRSFKELQEPRTK